MNGTGSAVVETMREAAEAAWKRWRAHVAAGTASTAEGIAAFDAATFAAGAYAGEASGRAALLRARAS